MKKPLNYKDPDASMNLEESTTYLKKIGEWESVWRFDRETISGWANFLKNKEKNNDVSTDSKNKRTTKSIRRVSNTP